MFYSHMVQVSTMGGRGYFVSIFINDINSADVEWFNQVLVEYYIARFTGFNFDLRLRFIVTV